MVLSQQFLCQILPRYSSGCHPMACCAKCVILTAKGFYPQHNAVAALLSQWRVRCRLGGKFTLSSSSESSLRSWCVRGEIQGKFTLDVNSKGKGDPLQPYIWFQTLGIPSLDVDIHEIYCQDWWQDDRDWKSASLKMMSWSLRILPRAKGSGWVPFSHSSEWAIFSKVVQAWPG